ncbi:MAG: terpene cyclase/mutase family protein [Kiritimatiellae bacterium]|nr:terpene cyclase/mutase family protein [Kiritimatiellia bacterium]
MTRLFRAISLVCICLASLSAVRARGTDDVFARYRERVDEAVERGLAYLARCQNEDGSFQGQYGRTAGIVGLCAMAFLAKGYTPLHSTYSNVVLKCVDYIVGLQDETGYLGGNNGRMYSHSIGTLLLCEVSGMVDEKRQKKIDETIAKAVRLILAAQKVKRGAVAHAGGWRYGPGSMDSDLSCSGWALMALRSARLNGAPVPEKAIQDAVAYVLRNCNEQTGQFGYQDKSTYCVTLTGAGILCLELCGHHGHPVTTRAGDFLLETCHLLPRQTHAFYGVYYAAQGMFQLGGKYWQKYAEWMYDYWLPRQTPEGSWPGGNVSPVYNTAMCLLSFTVPYRQLPIYQRDETVDEEP